MEDSEVELVSALIYSQTFHCIYIIREAACYELF